MGNESLTSMNLIQQDDVNHFIDHLKIGIYLFDSDGNSLIANNHFYTMFNYTMKNYRK